MQLIVILRVMGLLLMTFSTTLLPPLFVSAFYHDGAHFAFATPLFILLILGLWVKNIAILSLKEIN